jgi:effector-binding domain-containing protein
MQIAEYVCEVKELPAQPTMKVRRVASVQEIPAVVGAAYAAVMRAIGAQGAEVVGPPYVIYWNDDMSALQMDLGFPVAQPLPGDGDVEPGEIPAGRWAVTLHTGPYPDLGAAYRALEEWTAARGLQTAVSCEIYFNDPNEVPPAKLQTQVMYLLK